MYSITLNPTLSGGTAVLLKPSGVTAGKSAFVTPSSTRLAPRSVEMTASGSASGDNPIGRTGVKITFADRTVEEGCCTVREGAVIVDLGVRWSLNQPEALATSAIAHLRAIVNSAEFESAVLTGVLPQ